MRIQPGYSEDTAGVQQEYNQGTAGVQSGYSRGTVRVQQGYSQGTAGVQSGYSRGTVGIVGTSMGYSGGGWEDLSRKHKNNAKTSKCILYLL